MSKVLDWSKIAKSNITEGYREAHGIPTFRQAIEKAIKTENMQKVVAQERAAVEPILRQALLLAMLNKSEIIVKKTIQNPTESLGGLTKSDDDDGFYGVQDKNENHATSFEIVMESIPEGSVLVYKSWNKSLGQWIFKSNKGQEYAIYDKNTVQLDERTVIENPGLYGLLYNTSIADALQD